MHPISSRDENDSLSSTEVVIMDFLELRQARGVYSRVTTGMPILNGSLFSEVNTLV